MSVLIYSRIPLRLSSKIGNQVFYFLSFFVSSSSRASTQFTKYKPTLDPTSPDIFLQLSAGFWICKGSSLSVVICRGFFVFYFERNKLVTTLIIV